MDLQTALTKLAAGYNTNNREKIHGVAASCPHCGVFASFLEVCSENLTASYLRQFTADLGGRLVPRMLIQAKCSSCSCLALVASEYLVKGDKSELRLTLLWPRSIRPSKAPAGIEPDILKTYDQARAVLQDSPGAAATLARRCVQHVIRQKLGITKARLWQEIEEAIKRPELTIATSNSLDQIRTIGNWGAHPCLDEADCIIDVTNDEAHYTLDVLELLFHDLYHTPALVNVMKGRLESRRKAATESTSEDQRPR